mmetsp:Transcript_19965/g.34606  ORF Transcript_19965/g.34606 Transcript_19965/m.34606 type:complete len:221 (+) Transcript_19965:1796-2458(+)
MISRKRKTDWKKTGMQRAWSSASCSRSPSRGGKNSLKVTRMQRQKAKEKKEKKERMSTTTNTRTNSTKRTARTIWTSREATSMTWREATKLSANFLRRSGTAKMVLSRGSKSTASLSSAKPPVAICQKISFSSKTCRKKNSSKWLWPSGRIGTRQSSKTRSRNAAVIVACCRAKKWQRRLRSSASHVRNWRNRNARSTEFLCWTPASLRTRRSSGERWRR